MGRKALQQELDELSAGFRYLLLREQKKIVEEAHRIEGLSLKERYELSHLGCNMREDMDNLEEYYEIGEILDRIKGIDFTEYETTE